MNTQHELTPEERKWLTTVCNPEKLQRNLRRSNILIPIEIVALTLCIASLCIEGYDGLLTALSGLFFVQLIFLVINRREIKRQLRSLEHLTDKHSEGQ